MKERLKNPARILECFDSSKRSGIGINGKNELMIFIGLESRTAVKHLRVKNQDSSAKLGMTILILITLNYSFISGITFTGSSPSRILTMHLAAFQAKSS